MALKVGFRWQLDRKMAISTDNGLRTTDYGLCWLVGWLQ